MAKFTTKAAIRRIAGLDPFPLPPIIGTRYPVVLMHGFGVLAGLRRGGHLYAAAAEMRMRGVWAYAPNVAPYNTVSVRAEMWKERLTHVLEETGADRLNIIAHSMGGLDARYLITCKNLHSRVATLTTVSTPHRGTYIATFIETRPERVREIVADLAEWIGAQAVDGEADFRTAISELTPEHITLQFNRDVPDHPDVLYQSYGAAAGRGTSVPTNPFLRLGNSLLYSEEGLNDGIVSVSSAKWGEYLGTIEADHAAQVGLSIGNSRFAATAFYVDVAKQLAASGF